MQPFLGPSKAAEDNQGHLGLHLPMFTPKTKQNKRTRRKKNKPTQKPSKEKREEIATRPKMDPKNWDKA